jgi:hypothetical protein
MKSSIIQKFIGACCMQEGHDLLHAACTIRSLLRISIRADRSGVYRRYSRVSKHHCVKISP